MMSFVCTRTAECNLVKLETSCTLDQEYIDRACPIFLLSFSCFIQQLLMTLINLSGKFKFKSMIWTHWQPPYRRRCWASIFKGILVLLIRCLWVAPMGKKSHAPLFILFVCFTHLVPLLVSFKLIFCPAIQANLFSCHLVQFVPCHFSQKMPLHKTITVWSKQKWKLRSPIRNDQMIHKFCLKGTNAIKLSYVLDPW